MSTSLHWLCTVIWCLTMIASTKAGGTKDSSSCNLAKKLAACRALNLSGLSVPSACDPLNEIPGNLYRSCQEIHCQSPSSPSGMYNIVIDDTGKTREVYCEMDNTCGGIGGWTRVAYVDMTDSETTCPQGLMERTYDNERLCSGQDATGCHGTFFTTYGLSYTKVCGRLRGYQFGTPEAFSRSIVISSLTIDDQYLDGVSITHGSGPRKHIWSFPVGVTQSRADRFGCPCNSGNTVSTPTFVGNDYYCESAANSISSGQFYSSDVMWDGEQCVSNEQTCCDTSSDLPYFVKTLNAKTCDDIELRICHDEGVTTEGIPLELIELYIM